MYAILIEHVDPIPVDDETDEQVAKSISKVPSRSDGPSLHVSEAYRTEMYIHTNVGEGDRLCTRWQAALLCFDKALVLVIDPDLEELGI